MVLEPYPSSDDALALLLCLTIRIMNISLRLTWDHRLPMTRVVLGDIDWYTYGTEQRAIPGASQVDIVWVRSGSLCI
jgi:hypothetical protein